MSMPPQPEGISTSACTRGSQPEETPLIPCYHLPQNLLQNLSPHCGRNPRNVLTRIELNNIRPNNLPLDRMQMRDRLPHRHPARLAMRDSRRKRRIEHIHIERNINWPVNSQPVVSGQSSHLDHFNAKSRRLLQLMPIHRPNPHLQQSLRQPLLHDARKRTRMRYPAPLELVIQIRMSVKMNDRQLWIAPRKCLQDWISNRMIPAQRYRILPSLQQLAHRALNLCKIFAGLLPRIAQPQIPRICKRVSRVQIHSQFRPLIGSIAPHSFSDLRRRASRSAQKRRVRIKRNSQKSWHRIISLPLSKFLSVYIGPCGDSRLGCPPTEARRHPLKTVDIC